MSKAVDDNGNRYPRVLFFSSPLLSHNDIVLGSATRNNRSAVQQHLSTVINFREDPPSNPVVSPSNLQSTNQTTNSIDLSWTDNNNSESGFKIYRNNTYIASVGANITQYKNTGLSANTSYSYYVQAYNNSSTANSNVITVKTQVIPVSFNINGLSVLPYYKRDRTTYSLDITGSYTTIRWYKKYYSESSFTYLINSNDAPLTYSTSHERESFTLKVIINDVVVEKYVYVHGSGGGDLPEVDRGLSLTEL